MADVFTPLTQANGPQPEKGGASSQAQPTTANPQTDAGNTGQVQAENVNNPVLSTTEEAQAVPPAAPTPAPSNAAEVKAEVAAIKESNVKKDKVSKDTQKKALDAAKKVDSKKSADAAKVEERKKLLEAEKIFQEGLASIRDLIAPSSVEVAYDHMKVDGLYSQTFFVYTYPRYIDTNWLTPIVNYDVTMDVSQFVYPISSEDIMKRLKNKVAQLNSSIRMNVEKGNVRDPALETALEDAETLRTELQRGQEKFFQFGLYFTIYSEDLEELKRASKELQSLLAGKLVLSKRSDLQMERGFNSSIPLCLDEIGVDRNMNTSPLSTTFPFISSELTSNDGILYGLNRHNESLIIFDRFSLENANSVVFAKSGAGKSYAVKLEILRSLMFGTDVIVIDPENEYKALCETVGGTYLNVSLNSDRRINPFDLPSPLEGEEQKPGDLLRSSVINLTGLMRLMLGELTPQEEGILDKALIDTYATRGITMDVLDPSEFTVPTMEDFYSVLSSMEGAQDMAQRIAKYVNGTYAGVFNQETNITLDTGLMVFSVRDLEDELRPVAMYIILNYIWNRVRSSLKKRMLVVDEAWTLMQHEDSAKFMYGLVKRARKYFLGITTITQDVEDFIRSHYGKPIITNSSIQLLLKQSPSAIEPLTKVFNLTEGEKYLLLNSGVGQGLFFAGLKHVAIQIIASFSEDKIVTTNPEDLLAQQAVAAEYAETNLEEKNEPKRELPDGVPDVAEAAPKVTESDFATSEANNSEEAKVASTFEENVGTILNQTDEPPEPEAPVENPVQTIVPQEASTAATVPTEYVDSTQMPAQSPAVPASVDIGPQATDASGPAVASSNLSQQAPDPIQITPTPENKVQNIPVDFSTSSTPDSGAPPSSDVNTPQGPTSPQAQ